MNKETNSEGVLTKKLFDEFLQLTDTGEEGRVIAYSKEAKQMLKKLIDKAEGLTKTRKCG